MDPLLEATARAERDHFWFRGFRRFVTPLVERAAAAGSGSPGRQAAGNRLEILDCGAGTGHNLTWLARYGRPTGVDLTWSGLAHAKSAGHSRLVRASAAALPFRDSSFDLVTSFDLLQCLPGESEKAAVQEIRRVLRPAGHLVVNVAAFEGLRGNHSVLSHEVRRYNRARLRSLLDRAGFHVLAMSYTNATTLPLVAGVRAIQRVSGLASSDTESAATREITTPPAPINAALSGLLRMEALLVRLVPLPFGSSLIALATADTARDPLPRQP
jgi:ubiquinone/menaquinone biosynthesis C-methylase UbiE